ncbi:AAA family ATPase [Pseudomonas syringae pv. atrofaciens]|uniref:AAA family ATPase n=1 Tax=Pseudomonas syringae TaxID=317 RepID=UPI00351E1E35
MKVLYLGKASRRSKYVPDGDGNILELLSNDWDDYGYGTTFMTSCRVNGETVNLGAIKILVEDVKSTRSHLKKLLDNGWNGEFPIPDTRYISTAVEISFYEQLDAILGTDPTRKIANKLRDASLLVRVEYDIDALELIQSQGFRDSLQRERGAIQSYLDTWKIFAKKDIEVLDLGFKFYDVFNKTSLLSLKYQSDSPLPHDINVLIGANGSGKSQLLHQIVKSWIDKDETEKTGFIKQPNLSQVVVVSYSPFEQFPVDLHGRKFQDQDAYRYFGFRGRATTKGSSEKGKIRLSQTVPKRNAVTSLLDCLDHDKLYINVPKWVKKIEVAEKVLRVAFDFDFAAVCVSEYTRASRFYIDGAPLSHPPYLTATVNGIEKFFIPLTSVQVANLKVTSLRKYVEINDGLTFFKSGDPVQLSSGQRLFTYIVINILGIIRRSSLILVDEPELFLHPTLEIQFIEMLKEILAEFNSKALLATHSVVTVREMPADCVHVFERTKDGLTISNPPFQTFGGDNQRISSYVFNDQNTSKPFEKWIKQQVDAFGSAEDLLKECNDELNDEMVIQIKALGNDQW